MRNSIV